jgi:hypothetical protein
MKVALFMYDYKAGNLPDCFDNWFPVTNHEYATRQRLRGDIQTQFARTTFSQSLPVHHYPKIWSKHGYLSEICNSRHMFKFKLKKCFLSQYERTEICANPRCADCRQ